MVQTVAERFRQVRARTREIFDIVPPEAFDHRPIPLRHPIRFYEGHLASFNRGQLLQSRFLQHDPEPHLTTLFARGIDPLNQDTADTLTIHSWPDRERVHDYIASVDQEMERAIAYGDIDPVFLYTALEHEEMHQETLLYLIHRLPAELKRRPVGSDVTDDSGATPVRHWLHVDEKVIRLGMDAEDAPFGWDNEFPSMQVKVDTFEIATTKVTNGEFLEFVQAGGYNDPKYWSPEAWRFIRNQGVEAPPFWELRTGEWFYRGLFESIPLPQNWPVYVSYIEADAYTRWHGCRLPTEAEWHAAVAGIGRPEPERDNFNFVRWDLAPVVSDENVSTQLTGNGWEWTSSPFDRYPGFKPFTHYPGYSADFFDGRHFVLKGASPVTPAALVRPSFRNWFQDQYRYAYTAFRCAR